MWNHRPPMDLVWVALGLIGVVLMATASLDHDAGEAFCEPCGVRSPEPIQSPLPPPPPRPPGSDS